MQGKCTSPMDGMGMKHQNPMHELYWFVGFLDGPFSIATSLMFTQHKF